MELNFTLCKTILLKFVLKISMQSSVPIQESINHKALLYHWLTWLKYAFGLNLHFIIILSHDSLLKYIENFQNKRIQFCMHLAAKYVAKYIII